MIATELADALGADLGVTSANDLADELQLTAPAYAGLTLDVLHSDVAHDGIVLPLVDGATRPGGVEPIDPVALPGVESVERQGAPPRTGLAGGDGAADGRVAVSGPRPPLLSGVAQGDDDLHIPKSDNYALRLVATRSLYDAGSTVTGSPSLTPLVPTLAARANPYDLDRLGAKTGDQVQVRSARGTLVLTAEADAGVPRGVVALDFNLPIGPDSVANAASTLIDSRQPVTDVRMESV
jgi:predicted molibdopterin-dependent oxidoreductase YjgC